MKTIGVFGPRAEEVASMLRDWKFLSEAVSPLQLDTVKGLPEVLVLQSSNAMIALGEVETFRELGFFGRLVVLSDELLLRNEMVNLLMAGADHCLAWSDGADLLYATIQTSVRTYEERFEKLYTVGELTVDTVARRVMVRNITVTLRPSDYELLVLLVANQGQAMTREELLRRLRPDKYQQLKSQMIAVMVVKLRDMLSRTNCQGVNIGTVRKNGYRLEGK
jgi:DNA-binding response OmpR family regulator